MIHILEYLRAENILHRDIKPANFLVDENFDLKIADFGSAIVHHRPKLTLKKTNSVSVCDQIKAERSQDLFKYQDEDLVGTEAYISPEAIQTNQFEKVCFESDLWSLGVIIWQLFSSTQATPFTGSNQTEVFSAIKKGSFEMPDLATAEIADLISQILIRRPSERLGAFNFTKLKSHPVFSEINFENLYQGQ